MLYLCACVCVYVLVGGCSSGHLRLLWKQTVRICFWGHRMWLSDSKFFHDGLETQQFLSPGLNRINSSVTQPRVDWNPFLSDIQKRKRDHFWIFFRIYAVTNLSIQPISVPHQDVFVLWGHIKVRLLSPAVLTEFSFPVWHMGVLLSLRPAWASSPLGF